MLQNTTHIICFLYLKIFLDKYDKIYLYIFSINQTLDSDSVT